MVALLTAGRDMQDRRPAKQSRVTSEIAKRPQNDQHVAPDQRQISRERPFACTTFCVAAERERGCARARCTMYNTNADAFVRNEREVPALSLARRGLCSDQ